jgi:hypothetical protein
MRRSPMPRGELRVAEPRAKLDIPTGTCKVCEKPFVKRSTLHTICSQRCVLRMPVIEKKAEKAKDRAAKEALKTKPQLLEEAQIAFRAWIRARDFGKPCICCGKYPKTTGALTGGQWDGGHYRSRGACPELAFDERNCHAQLKDCNTHAWDVATYRANLIERIGLEQVEDLEGSHPAAKFSRDELREMRDRYRKLERELTKGRQA